MTMLRELAIPLATGILPVCIFLATLIYLDSYKLVRFRAVVQVIGWGCAAAVIAYACNRMFMSLAADPRVVTRVAAPVVEEILKALPVLVLLRTHRIGFLVDAAIFGFAVGTGFALIENLYYFVAVPEFSFPLAVVRGFGTAMMHGGTTAIVAIATKALSDRREAQSWTFAAPGVAIAIAIHVLFNSFFLSPVLSALAMIITLPLLLILVFERSERYLQSWLGSGFDLHSELIQSIHSGAFAATPSGSYLQSLRERFDGATLADMLCYLRLHAELSLRAKGMLMLRENGFEPKIDPEIEEKLDEMRFLKRSIGRTGELALAPIVGSSSREVWQLQVLAAAR